MTGVLIEREDGFGYQALTEFAEKFSPSGPSLENILPEWKPILPNADFVIEGYVDPTEPLRDEGPFGDHTGYYTLPEPYPVFRVTAIKASA